MEDAHAAYAVLASELSDDIAEALARDPEPVVSYLERCIADMRTRCDTVVLRDAYGLGTQRKRLSQIARELDVPELVIKARHANAIEQLRRYVTRSPYRSERDPSSS